MNKHNPKKFFGFGHFWPVTGDFTAGDPFRAQNEAEILKI
jgi:hypothetical protein